MKNSRLIIPVWNTASPKGRAAVRALSEDIGAIDESLMRSVTKILAQVRMKGDDAVISLTRAFDRVELTRSSLRIDPETITARAGQVPGALRRAIREAARRIEAFHRMQRPESRKLITREAVLSYRAVALHRVGVYVPGGYTVYPSSVLMNVIPARIAGVKQIVAVTPPGRELDPAVAFALSLLKVEEVYRIGGAQAIAALAYGTQTIARVDKIVGPGNAYVAAAKRLVFGTVDIDTIAGPSEVVILADDSAPPRWVGLDLLAQAEHGSGNERAVCITEDAAVAAAVRESTLRDYEVSPVRGVLQRLPAGAIAVVVTRSRQESIDLINRIAPEHLQLMTRDPGKDLAGIQNAAAVFLGAHTPVALGDYFIGTNHVLPTGGAARFSSPLGVESFIKRMSVARADAAGLRRAAPFVSILARSETFVHHALSVEQRLESEAEPGQARRRRASPQEKPGRGIPSGYRGGRNSTRPERG